MFRSLCGRYKARLMLKLLMLTFYSLPVFAEALFENVEPNTQKQLMRAISAGIPIYSGNFDTGKVSWLEVDAVTKVSQHGNIFTVCAGKTTLFEIKFQCFKSETCRFTTNGSVKKGRFNLEQCLITSASK